VVRSPGARPAAGSRPGTSAGGHHHDHDHHGHSHAHGGAASINLRSAVLHVIGDIVQSIGVAIAGALIWWKQDDPRWYIADPICTFVFSIVVLLTTKSVLRDILHVLMERTPTNMDIPAMSQVSGVEQLHVFGWRQVQEALVGPRVHLCCWVDARVLTAAACVPA
jgi:zinc transporter 2